MNNSPMQIESNVVKPKMSFIENEVENRLIDLQTELALDQKISDVELYMASNVGFGKTNEEKDALYAKAKELWQEYAKTLRDTFFSFYLNRKQYHFLTELLRDKLEYDVNTVFLAIELTDTLASWIQEEGKHKGDNDIKGFKVDATEITYIYHLIAKHKVTGLKSSTYTFASVLKRIGEISKIISYYDTAAKNLSKEIQEWVAAFELPLNTEQQVSSDDSVKAKKIEPKKKKSSNTVSE